MDATPLGPRHTEDVLPNGQTGRTRRLRAGTVGVRASRVAAGSEPGAARLQAEDLWNTHGRSAYALACALLGDETAAIRAVALGMTDFARSDVSTSADDARRSLARHVYWRSTELTAGTSSMTPLPPAMVWLGQLAQLQRTCLALCVFGAHSHRQAAGLLGLTSLAVARMLTSGLQELGRLGTAEIALGV